MKSFEVVAPRLAGGKIPVLQEGFLWEVPVRQGPCEGWGLWRVTDFQADSIRPAAAWERSVAGGELRVVTLVEQHSPGSWSWSGPGRTSGRVHLVDQGAELDAVRAVHDGKRWWCLGLAPGQARKARRWREQLNNGTVPRNLKPSLGSTSRVGDEGDRLRRAVQLAGGQLLSWASTPNGLQVRWVRLGEEHTSLVDRDLNLQHAGFCLANTDRQHDLTSLVSLVGERHPT